jgi:prepilin-type N-terminal cleavage/methylation domain-containing protein
MRTAFTLIELLIVIGLLAAVAMILLPNLTTNKDEVKDTIIISELADIQRAFIRFQNDCNLQNDDNDLLTVAKYGVAVLIYNDNDYGIQNWDNDQQRGWRGPYLMSEGEREININIAGQPNGNVTVPVILTPTTKNGNEQYYRILPTDDNQNIILNLTESNANQIRQLWLVYPHYLNDDPPIPIKIPEQNDEKRKYYRLLYDE